MNPALESKHIFTFPLQYFFASNGAG